MDVRWRLYNCEQTQFASQSSNETSWVTGLRRFARNDGFFVIASKRSLRGNPVTNLVGLLDCLYVYFCRQMLPNPLDAWDGRRDPVRLLRLQACSEEKDLLPII